MTRTQLTQYCLAIAIVACPAILIAQDVEESAVPATDEPKHEDTPRAFHVLKLDPRINADVARRVVATLLDGSEGLRIEAMSEPNRLFAWASQDEMEKISKVLESLDELVASEEKEAASDTTGSLDRQLQSYQLKYNRALDAAQLFKSLFGDSEDLSVAADARANQLLVRGTPEQHKAVAALIQTLDRPAQEGEGETRKVQQRVFTLKHAIDAGPVVEKFEAMFGKAGRVGWSVNVTGNQIQFYGTEEQIQRAAELIDQLDNRQFKVFSLQRADAVETVGLLRELFRGSALTITADARTNSLVASGTEDVLQVVQALLLTLDAEESANRAERESPAPVRSDADGTAPRQSNGATEREPVSDGASSDLKDQYAAAEREAASRAAVYRWAEESKASPEDEIKKMKADLRAAVERAFEARQRLQAEDVEHLKRQLTAIEARIRQREAIREQIIQRRVDDLLENVDTSWWPKALTDATAGGDTVTTVRHLPERLEPDQLPALQGKVQVEYVEDLDVLIIRGHEGDVRRFSEMVETFEKSTAAPAAGDVTSPGENKDAE